MRILLLCHSFNSLSQRLHTALTANGHTLSVELDISDEVTQEACILFKPDLLIAPFLKRRLPDAVWQSVVSLVVHPGPPGDRGPSALDWAVLHRHTAWGVTVLQANAEFDAGPVWAHANFAMRPASKGSLYRAEVTQAAVDAVLQAVTQFECAQKPPPAGAGPVPTDHWQPAMPQAVRRIDWAADSTESVLARLCSADGQPGVADSLFGLPCHLFDGHPATGTTLTRLTQSPDLCAPGVVLAQRDGALLRRTVDGGVWIGQVRLARACGDNPAFKLPAALAFAAEAVNVPQWDMPLMHVGTQADEWSEISYSECGPVGARAGYLSFDFYNGAMSTVQCERLLEALQHIKQRDTQVLLLLGGHDFFSNGIHLNVIEAAAHRVGDSAADESWRNINAMNDVAEAIINTTDRLTLAVLRGNAGAGGCFLALAADAVWSYPGVVLNPHYRNMGNLYGSEYWTYLLPQRLGDAQAKNIMRQRLPLSAAQALQMGLIDRIISPDCTDASVLQTTVLEEALALAASPDLPERVLHKRLRRAADETLRPLANYRREELTRMHRNFYGFDPSYHIARYHFVHKLPHAWTPRHLAAHRP
jgi:putative two-component system protein, hydrogenase maturation factor HypX/HoxX